MTIKEITVATCVGFTQWFVVHPSLCWTDGFILLLMTTPKILGFAEQVKWVGE